MKHSHRIGPTWAPWMALLLAGCGDSAPTSPPASGTAAVASVEIAPAAASLPVGGSRQLVATAKDAQGSAIGGKSFAWTTSNASVATVSSTGLVNATAPGNATITAAVDGRAGSAAVAVADVVTSVEVSPGTSSLLQGASVALTAVAKNAAGALVGGKTFVWTTSNAAVASVSLAGQVTTIAPGTATISASVDGRSGSAAIEVVDPLNIPAFSRPFAASAAYRVTNYHDHDIPRSFFDNGRKLSFWGEVYDIVGYEGHQGYDFRMDEGTPILAVAGGTVVTTSHPSFYCPLTDQQIPADGNGYLLIEHPLPGGVRVRALYAHLSRKDVAAGQTVAAGQQVGLSGNNGCSLNPHLHFEVVRQTQTNNSQPAPIDPWGWEGAGTDPWVAHAEGAASIRLWKPGEAPDLFVRYSQPVNQAGGTLFFGVTAIQPMGYKDAQNPNNEYVEVSRDPAFAPASLDIGGATIRTRAGTVYTFPAGTTLSAANPTVRVYTGAGTGSGSVQYMGRPAPVYDNIRECVGVYNAAGAIRNQVAMGVSGCS